MAGVHLRHSLPLIQGLEVPTKISAHLPVVCVRCVGCCHVYLPGDRHQLLVSGCAVFSCIMRAPTYALRWFDAPGDKSGIVKGHQVDEFSQNKLWCQRPLVPEKAKKSKKP